LLLEYLLYFVAGGSIVSLVVYLAKQGHPFLSGIALVFPSVTMLSFYFIGRTTGSAAVVESAKSALFATFIVWVPYVLVIVYLTPRLGVNTALAGGVIIFMVLALLWIYTRGNVFIQ
jgi:uncharacterized membrane protein (GlpM family)